MTPAERQLCWDFANSPEGLRRRLAKWHFRLQFPAAVTNGRVSTHLLTDACDARSADDLDCVITVGFVFGFAREHIPILCDLVTADWHTKHEDVVSALDDFRTPAATDAFFAATQWIPSYLDYDDARALAVKAIWGLGKLATPEAVAHLTTIAKSDNAILRTNALDQLERVRVRSK